MTDHPVIGDDCPCCGAPLDASDFDAGTCGTCHEPVIPEEVMA